jgi:hypothetical protein
VGAVSPPCAEWTAGGGFARVSEDMNTPFLRLVFLTLVVFLPVGYAQKEEEGELVQWTSIVGTSVEARFVRAEGATVILKGKDGRLMRLPISNLSEDSQAMIDRLSGKTAAGTEGAAMEPEGRGDLLGDRGETEYKVPTFAAGPWKGMHAVYDAPTYQAIADSRGGVRILQKENGLLPGVFGYAYLWPSLLYYPEGELQFRKIVRVEAKQNWTKQPKKLEFEGLTDSATTFEITYEFDKDGVSLFGSVKDPKGIEEETVLRLGVRFPRYREVESTMSEEAQLAVLGESFIEAAPMEGKKLRFDFITRENLNGLESVKKGLQWVKVKSVMCGPAVYKVTAPDLKYGTLRLWNASSSPPYWGFGASLFRLDPGEKSSEARVTIGVE